jgi:hypothetical protein
MHYIFTLFLDYCVEVTYVTKQDRHIVLSLLQIILPFLDIFVDKTWH